MRREIGSISSLCFTVFTLISLISYNALDLPLYTSSPNSPLLNKAGIIGAYLSGYLLYFPFGLGAWFLPLITLVWAYNGFYRKRREKLSIKLLGVVLVFLTSSCAFSFSHIDTSWGYFPPGGLAGDLFSDLMRPWFGKWGSYLMIFFLFIVGFLLSSEFLVVSWIKSAKKYSGEAIGKVFALLRKPKTKRIKIRREPEITSVSRVETQREVKPEPKAEPKSGSEPVVHTHVEGKPSSFQLPSLDLLDPSPPAQGEEEDLDARCRGLEDALRSFGVESRVLQVNQGPIISSFEIEPARGVKVSQITSLADDIALVMKASRVRVVAPIPGKSAVGIEIPNLTPRFVYLREVLESQKFRKDSSKLAIGLGKDILGRPLVANLGEMPHILIAGTTGSGKTVCLNTIILSILFQATPEEVRFLMIDPKMVELAVFGKMPHLIAPVVSSPKKASKALRWVIDEMERRYRTFAEEGVRNIASYNQIKKEDKMAHIVVIIDELHDLMMVAQSSVEEAITRVAQLSRAVGMHLVIATQRPSVDVITGVIKANLPYRISFQVSSKVDSRTVLDMNGAEKLLGKGDMLFLPPGEASPIRAQGSLVTDKEIERVVSFLKSQRGPDYKAKIDEAKADSSGIEPEEAIDDELFDQAVRLVLQAGKGSTSMLQRRLSVGYARAARLLDSMEEKSIISSPRGTKPRVVLTDQKRDED